MKNILIKLNDMNQKIIKNQAKPERQKGKKKGGLGKQLTI